MSSLGEAIAGPLSTDASGGARSDGDLRFEESESGGTRVVVTLEAA